MVAASTAFGHLAPDRRIARIVRIKDIVRRASCLHLWRGSANTRGGSEGVCVSSLQVVCRILIGCCLV